jgi:hypothetical protein
MDYLILLAGMLNQFQLEVPTVGNFTTNVLEFIT